MGGKQSCPENLADKRYKLHVPNDHIRKTSTTSSRKSPAYSESTSSESEDKDICPHLNGSLVGDSSAQKKHFLSRRERVLLAMSWKKTRKTGQEHVGSKIFLMVLISQPEIKAIFGLEKIPQGRLKYDPRFRQHAIVFLRTFDYVIKNIEYPDKLETHFENLGRKHVVMQGRGFDPTYWETFAECMTQVLTSYLEHCEKAAKSNAKDEAAVEWESKRQRPTIGAWRTLVSVIITWMRRGFDEDNAKRIQLRRT